MSLSYRRASKLSDEQKCKLIACQASRALIAPWEVEALLNFCQTNGNGWIDRGMALMYEYAGYMDSMRLNTNQRSDCMADIAMMIHDLDKYSLTVIEEKIITATGMTYNAVHALGQWRKLQWSPKTLFLTDSENDRKSLQMILEDEANAIVNAILTISDENLSRLQSIDIIKLESLAALVSPCIDYPEFAKLFAFKKSYNNLRLKLMFSTMKDLLSVESNIEASWESIRRATKLSRSLQDSSLSGGLSDDPCLLYPTLRLPYDSSCYPPTEDLSWFNDSTHKYEALDAVITAVIAAQEAPGQTKAFVGSKDKPSHDRRIDASHAVESTPQATVQVQDTSIVIQKFGKKKDAIKMYSSMKRPDEVTDRISIIGDETAITSSSRYSSLVSPSISPRPPYQAAAAVAVQKDSSPRADESDHISSSSRGGGGEDNYTERRKQQRANSIAVGTKQFQLELPAKSNNMNEDDVNHGSTAETVGDLRKRSVTIATVSHTDPSVAPTLETNRRVTHGGEMTARLTEASLIMFHHNRNVLESVQDADSEISALESTQSSPSKVYTDDVQLASKEEDCTYMHNDRPDKEVKLGDRTYDLSVDGSTVEGEETMKTAHLEEEDCDQPLEASKKLNVVDKLSLDVKECGSEQSEETERGIIIGQQLTSHDGSSDTNRITAIALSSDSMTLTTSVNTIGATCDMEQRVNSPDVIVNTLTSTMDAADIDKARYIHLAVDNRAVSIDIELKYLKKIEDTTDANNPSEEVDISEHDDLDDNEVISPEFLTPGVMLEAVVPIAMRGLKTSVTADYGTIDDPILAMGDAVAVVYNQAVIVHEEPSTSFKPEEDNNMNDTSAIIDVPSTDRHAMTVMSQYTDGAAVIDQSKSFDSNQSVQVENSPAYAQTEVDTVSADSEINQIYEEEVTTQRETSIRNHFPSLEFLCSNEVMQEKEAAAVADFTHTVQLSEETTSQITAVEINRNEMFAKSASSDMDDFIQNDDDLSSFSPDRTHRSRNVSFEYLFKEFSDSTSDKQETSPTVSNWHRKRAVSSPAVSIGGLHQLRSSRALSTRTILPPNLQKNKSPSYYNAEQQLLNLDAFETLEILDNLSRPFVQYHERSNRQEINTALRNLRVNGRSVEEIAVTKLQVWWRLVFPRKKLMKRIHARDFCKEIAYNCAEDAMKIVMIKRAKRRRMLRIGACLTIQRCFRKFRLHSMGSLRNVRLKTRSNRACYLLEIWRRAAAAGIRIYRYLRYLKLKKIIKSKKIAGKKEILLRRTVLNYIHALALHKKLEFQKRFLERIDTTTISIGRSSKFFNDRQKAAIIIQKYYRRYSVILTMLNRKVINLMYSKITFFFIRFVARRRVRLRMKREQSVKLIQKIFRGFIARKHVLDMVTSGLILKYTWKKYQSYKSLKSQLRRIDRPYTITMHGIRNLQRSTLNSRQLKFKISIWWHPLLHIVSRSDVDVIVKSKQPQLIYTSSQFEVQNEEVDNNARRTSIVDGFRMIGSSLLSAPTIVGRNNLLSIHTSNAVSLRPLTGMTVGPPINKNVPLSSENLSSSSGSSSSSDRTNKMAVVGRNRSSSVLSIDALPSRMIQKNLIGTKEEVEVEEDSEDEEEDDDEYNVDEDVQVKTEALKARRSFLIKRMMMSHNDPSSSINNGVVNTSASVLKYSSDNNSFSATTTRETPTMIPSQATDMTAMLKKKKLDTAVPVAVPDVSQVYRKRPTSILGRLTIMRNPRVSNWDSKMLCSFDNQVIKIPGCHGNSVIKFDIIDGDRVHGNTTFYMNRDGEMMYWGGTYNLKLSLFKEQRRAAHHRVQDSIADDPVLDFKISSGGPLRSKCSWGRLAVRGKGPLRRLLQARRIFSSLVFDKWYRFYFSIDENGLSFYDSKFSNVATHLIPLKDFKEISVDIGAPIRESPTDAARNIVEDIHNIKLVTHSKDEIYMRFVDENTRLGWQEVLYNSVVFSIANDGDDDDDDDKDDDRSTHHHHIGGSSKHSKDTSWYIDSVLKRRKYATHSGIIYSSRRFNQLVDQPKSTFVSNLLNRLSLSPSEKESPLSNDEVMNVSNDKDKQVICKPLVNNNSQNEIIKKDRVYMGDSNSTSSSTIQPPSREHHSIGIGGYINTTGTNITTTTSRTTTTTPFHTPTPKSSIMHKALKPNLTEVLKRQRSQIQF